jgi:CRISPR-associated protein Cas2
MVKEFYSRIDQYRILWVFVSFDLPVVTQKDRKHYSRFRKLLLKDGFNMMQYSLYARHCNSSENAEVHKKRVKSILPPKGEVAIYMLTDKQFGAIEFYRNITKSEPPKTPQQLELF